LLVAAVVNAIGLVVAALVAIGRLLLEKHLAVVPLLNQNLCCRLGLIL
jgi:hypothetical protein